MKSKPAKPPAPQLVIDPAWGYSCQCPLCDERFQNSRDMLTSERMYERHWRDKHRERR
jgi:hypothetical protein